MSESDTVGRQIRRGASQGCGLEEVVVQRQETKRSEKNHKGGG